MSAKTTVRDICEFMDVWAPPGWAYSWDKIGLHTGSPQQTVERILLCLTVSPAAVETAIQKNISMIVAHHPLIWDPIKTLRSDIPQNKVYLDLCNAGIACFSAHTNLDIAPDGVNAALAKALQLQETAVLFHEAQLSQVKLVSFVPETHQRILLDALATAGAGVIGNYTHCSFNTSGKGTFLPGREKTPFSGRKGMINEEAEIRVEMLVDRARLHEAISTLRSVHPYEEPAFDIVVLENTPDNIGLGLAGRLKTPMGHKDFVDYVRHQLSIPYVVSYGRSKGKIRNVAVLGGSGGSYISQIPETVDAFVTGDVGYHDAEVARLQNLVCIDATHYGTEFPIVKTMATRLQKAFPAIETRTFKEKSGSGDICTTQI